MLENSIVFDIETIPSQEQWVKDRVRENLKPPGTLKKEDSIAAWWNNESAQALQEAYEKTTFEGATNHIISICASFGGSEDIYKWFVTDVSEEKGMIADFFASIPVGCHIWAGHNILGFDLRVLKQRAMILGVRLPSFFPWDPKPWDKTCYDTMLKWGNGRDFVSADLLAKAFGIQGKGSVDGSQVWPMFQDGKYQEIADYCADDVRMTLEIYKRMIFAV